MMKCGRRDSMLKYDKNQKSKIKKKLHEKLHFQVIKFKKFSNINEILYIYI